MNSVNALSVNEFSEYTFVEQKNSENKLTNLFWKFINGIVAIFQMLINPIYALFDEGIANALGLQVLRHGTSFPNYVSIMTEGAKADFGGTHQGSSAPYKELLNPETKYVERSKNRFHVFKDSDASARSTVMRTYTENGIEHEEEISNEPICNSYFFSSVVGQVFNRALPTLHSTLSGIHSFTSENETGPIAKIKEVAGGIFGFLTPTLRFKFTPEEMHATFETDPDYSGMALRTTKDIGTDHLGILGSLRQGLNLQVFERIYHHPLKFLLGLIQIVAAVALSALIVVGAALLIA